MNPKTEELLNRTFEFGVNCLLFLESLPKTKVNAVITFQLAKASTSIGSNYEEAQGAESSKDFIHKNLKEYLFVNIFFPFSPI